jgi:hypothetical protein
MSMVEIRKLLIGGNVFFVFATIIINVLANLLPINGKNTGVIADSIPNLFVPSGITFAIWGVIYVLLIGFAMYQLLDLFGKVHTESGYVQRISFWFILASLGNIIWIFLWHYEQIVFSLFPMILLFVSLLMIYQRLEIGSVTVSKMERYLVHLMVSVYFGWITVAMIAQVTAALVVLDVGALVLGEMVWTILVILVIMLITLLFLLRKKDIAYALVIVWALLGIVIKRVQPDPIYGVQIEIAITAAITGIVILIGILYTAWERQGNVALS